MPTKDDVFVSFNTPASLKEIKDAFDSACIAVRDGLWKNIRLGKDAKGNSALVGSKIKRKKNAGTS